ncbi:hypothetical protein FA13DRAFT_111613 [Coprinellus micaceus]|uniref:Protein kinase domain-containing protein n=1 Tax=Coprinellus micaceus TaxID=71717 RepID=A0A4Y7THX5_COPMI|nr:hypothetical protein FA13DRAFT_111613 [Coprinellus micaceus]
MQVVALTLLRVLVSSSSTRRGYLYLYELCEDIGRTSGQVHQLHKFYLGHNLSHSFIHEDRRHYLILLDLAFRSHPLSPCPSHGGLNPSPTKLDYSLLALLPSPPHLDSPHPHPNPSRSIHSTLPSPGSNSLLISRGAGPGMVARFTVPLESDGDALAWKI